jgi:hypothetical protein
MKVWEHIYLCEGAVIEQKNQHLIAFGLGASA